MGNCIQCNMELTRRASKYCSNQCQSDDSYSTYIDKWLSRQVDGSRGVRTKNMSNHVLRYIMEKYAMQCARCGWKEINSVTGKSPLEVDHIDGNSENNEEMNLILLCPNCHSLTSNYKNLNKGNGRVWRREKYVKIV